MNGPMESPGGTRKATSLGPERDGYVLNLLDQARIDVRASRDAGEPRRTPARLRVHHRPTSARAPQATIVALHDTGVGGAPWWAHGVEVLDVRLADHGQPTVGTSSPGGALARTDHDLALLRSAVFDLHAVVTTRPRSTGERLLLVASGVAAGGALIALGAGLSPSVGADDPLRHELLLDLIEGDPLHEQIVDDVAPRIAAAVLIDPDGAADDWRDVALGRVTTPLALIERRGAETARRGFAAIGGSDRLHARVPSEVAVHDLVAALAARSVGEVFEHAAERPWAFGATETRHARGALAEAWPTEICRSDCASDLVRTLWRMATQVRPQHGWS